MEQEKKTRFHIPGKLRRRFVRVVAVLLGIYLLILVAISIYLSSSEERLLGILNSKLENAISGELEIGKADVTIWKTFPRAGIVLSDVTIKDSVYHIPFLKAGTIVAEAGLLNLIGHKLTINAVKLEDAKVYTFTDSKGYSNSYVVQPRIKQTQPSKNKKALVFKKVTLENVTFISENAIKNKRQELLINDATAGMRLSGSKYHITLDEDIFLRGLGFNFSKGYWLENQRIQAKWKFVYDTSGKVLSFNDTKVKIEDQPFILKGKFVLSDSSHFHLEASTKAIPYKTALAILKPTTSIKLKKIGFDGNLNVNAVLDGPMTYRSTPVVKVDFNTAESNLNMPVATFTDCSFSGKFINNVNPGLPCSDSNSAIIINPFACKWGDIDLTAKQIAISNLNKPFINFDFFSECTLPQFDEQFASSTLSFINGNAKLSLAYNGPLVTNASLFQRLSATIEMKDGEIVYLPRNITFSACNGAVTISGNSLLMKNFECNVNTSHFVVNVSGENLDRLSGGNNANKATITCNVFTPALDLAAFRTLFAKKGSKRNKGNGKGLAGIANTIDNTVDNGNLVLNVNAKQLSLDHFAASNVVANLFFKEDNWEIKQASLNHADGNFNLTSKVQQLSNGFHRVNAQVKLKHINVKKLFYGFNNFSQSDITYKNITGIMDATANITSDLNNRGQFVTSSMNGNIDFSLKNASLVNVEALTNIQQYIFKNRGLDNVQFATLSNNFKIQNGDINIPRMIVQSSALTMYIEGIYSFANKTDISIQVPFSTLKNRPEDYKNIDKAKAEKPGSSIYLRAKERNGQVKIGLDLFHKRNRNKNK